MHLFCIVVTVVLKMIHSHVRVFVCMRMRAVATINVITTDTSSSMKHILYMDSTWKRGHDYNHHHCGRITVEEPV